MRTEQIYVFTTMEGEDEGNLILWTSLSPQ